MQAFNKAWVSLIMAALVIIEDWFGWSLPGITEEWIVTILSIIAPILVWLVPNRETA